MGASAFRKFAVSAAAVAVLGGLGSQAAANDVPSFGVRVGGNYSVMDMKYSTFGNKVRWTVNGRSATPENFDGFGFHAGLQVGIPLSEIELGDEPYFLGLSPGALFVSRIGKSNVWDISRARTEEYSVSAYYLDVPIPVTFKREFSGFNVKVDIGLNASIGLFGTQKITYKGTVVEETGGKLEQDAFDEGLERVDVGIFASVTWEFSGFFISYRYGEGFLDNSIVSNYLSIGYSF
jgi:hypothetical protein